VSLVGWSTGAPRAGGFAALHPEAVDKLVLFGPSPYFPSDDPPAAMPEPGAPMILQSWDMLMNRRWQADVRMNFGWRANVARIRAPTLILVGEFDNYEKRRDAWTGLRIEHKAFIKVACASHFMQYERGRHLLHRATREWLASGTIEGRSSAELCAGPDGRIQPLG
jgi:pimeloyl-ACP methyl ester carboxylesterase